MAVDEKSSLIGRSLQNCLGLRRKYKYVFVSSKQVVIYLILIGVVLSIEMCSPELFVYLKKLEKSLTKDLEYVFIGLWMVYLLYPIFGYIGEKWTRYLIIMTGVVVVCVALFAEIVVSTCSPLFFHAHRKVYLALVTLIILFLLLGQAMLGANFVQFGLDQIQSAPSQELASYARWSVFVLFLACSCVTALDSILQVFPDVADFHILQAIFGISMLTCTFIGFYFKRFLIIESPPRVDPFKLNWKVIKYAWNHKYPVNRSSFTYNDDPPSRLDFGKERYGGPFTTDEVENVKSFWNVLAVILSSTLLSNFDLGDTYFGKRLNESLPLSDAERVLSYTNSNYLVVLIIPVLHLVIFPLFPCLVYSMLRRIWFGLVLILSSFLAAAIISSFAHTERLAEGLIFLEISNGIGNTVVSFSSLEFILAQGPHHMQGLLVGFWGIQFATEGILHLILAGLSLFVFYSVVTGLMLSSFIAFTVIMHQYRFRIRNEPSDINVRSNIEEIYEKTLTISPRESSGEESVVSII